MKAGTTLPFAALLALLFSGCTSLHEHVEARGEVLGRAHETCVDSDLAADYLAHFDLALASPDRRPAALAELPECGGEALEPEALRGLSERYSVDVAALYAADCLIRENRDLVERFTGLLDEIRSGGAAARDSAGGRLRNLTVVFVPGWDYIESGSVTGADFAQQRALLDDMGVANHLVPIDPNGSVEENAAVIRAELRRRSVHEEELVIVSASSGGPAVALALGSVDAAGDTDRVRGWLNLGGILGGMPLIDEYSRGIRRVALATFVAMKGWRMEAIESMSAARSRERLRHVRLPEHVAVVNYIGIPLTGDVSSRIGFFYSSLRALGPNDGLTLITGPILPGTRTIVALGQDHFFADDPEIESKSIALTSLLSWVASDALKVARAKSPGGAVTAY